VQSRTLPSIKFSGLYKKQNKDNDIGNFNSERFISDSFDFNDLLKTFREKGSEKRINLDDVSNIITEFRKFPNLQIKSLKGDLLKKFNQMKNFVEILQKKPTSYKLLIKELERNFSNLHQIKPGTVAAYFYGCFINNDMNDSCSLLCANSIPPLYQDDLDQCAHLVIKAKFIEETGNYIFDINSVPPSIKGRKLAYVYLDCESNEDFPGFSNEEIKFLSELGVTYFRLLKHKHNRFNKAKSIRNKGGSGNNDYVEFTDKPILLKKAKRRNKEYRRDLSKYNRDGQTSDSPRISRYDNYRYRSSVNKKNSGYSSFSSDSDNNSDNSSEYSNGSYKRKSKNNHKKRKNNNKIIFGVVIVFILLLLGFFLFNHFNGNNLNGKNRKRKSKKK